MPRRFVFTLCTLFTCTIFAAAAFANDPPPIVANAPRIQLRKPARLVVPASVGPRVPLTITGVRQLPLSPSAANALVASLTSNANTVTADDAVAVNTSSVGQARRRATREPSTAAATAASVPGRNMHIRALTTPSTQQAAYTPLDDNKEQEPAIMTLNLAGVEESATTFMRYSGMANVQLRCAKRWFTADATTGVRI